MFEIVKNTFRTPKWYDRETKMTKCCFCDKTKNMAGVKIGSFSAYICPECEKKMRKKYPITWDFRFLTDPRSKIYNPELVSEAYKKFKILNEDMLIFINDKFAKTCPICGEKKYFNKFSDFDICYKCKSKLPGYDHCKNVNSKYFIIEKCEEHGYFVTNRQNKYYRECPICHKKIYKK